MRISDWSSDVCSSDLAVAGLDLLRQGEVVACLRLVDVRDGDQADIETLAGLFELSADGGLLGHRELQAVERGARKSVGWGQSVSVRVDLGGRRIIKKKKKR